MSKRFTHAWNFQLNFTMTMAFAHFCSQEESKGVIVRWLSNNFEVTGDRLDKSTNFLCEVLRYQTSIFNWPQVQDSTLSQFLSDKKAIAKSEQVYCSSWFELHP